MRLFRGLIVWAAAALTCRAEIITTLDPQTVQQFESYVHEVEGSLEQRWSGKLSFLSLDERREERTAVLGGELWIEPGNPKNPVPVHDGLVHDWVGAVFIPNIDIAKVMSVMQDFNRHSQIYPEVNRSRLISRDGNEIKGYWRLVRRQSMVTAVFDITQETHWREVSPGKWICMAYAKNVSEVEHAGTPEEKVLPPGQGTGYMWRLYAYWSLEQRNGGVLAECRTVSLSRDVPVVLSWIVKPFVQSLPRESLASTLENTRAAAEKGL